MAFHLHSGLPSGMEILRVIATDDNFEYLGELHVVGGVLQK